MEALAQHPQIILPDYNTLRSKYLPWIKGLVTRHGGQPEIAEDLLHDAWLAVLEGNKPQPDRASATTYLLAIVKFKWYAQLRNQGRFKKALDCIILDVTVNPETEEVEERYDKVDTAFKRLKTACQFLIYSVFWLAKPLSEIRQQLNHSSEQSVYNAKHRCLKSLKADLKTFKPVL